MDTYPASVELPDKKLVDCFGQSKSREWEGKTQGLEELKTALTRQAQETDNGYPFEDWSVKNDPLMIGYFLRNEPAWAFVDNLVLADEVLHNPARTACKEMLVAYLQERYQDIGVLNRAWNSSLESFGSLYAPQE